jgi:predicted dehydrogenase
MDHGCAVLSYPGGRIGQFEVNLLAPEGQEYSLTIVGERGEIRAELWTGDLRWLVAGTGWEQTTVPCTQPVAGFAGMRESIRAFIAAILKGHPVRADLDVTRRVHETMLACARAEAERALVTLEPL